jgi:hypothetical protein
MACATGNGWTVSFTNATWTGRIESVTVDGITLEMLDDSTLESAGHMEKCAADLTDPGTLSMVVRLDLYAPEELIPDGQQDTITVTAPLTGAMVSGATLTGTGYITTGGGVDSLANNTLVNRTIVWTWDGKTGPTWTAAADS